MHPHWSQTLSVPPRGLALAREAACILVWDADHHLTLLNRDGVVQAQRPARAPCTAASIADDGSSVAVGGEAGQVWVLAPDLSQLWQHNLPYRVTAIALSPLGDFVAAADAGGGLHVLDRRGQPVWRAATPRALHYLTFVPEQPCLVGAADFGLVTCFDVAGRCLWQEGLVAHAGSLSASHDGGILTLACFTEGLVSFNLQGTRLPSTGFRSPCRRAALSYDGNFVLCADLDKGLTLLARNGEVLTQFVLESAPAGIALGPLAEYAVAATTTGLHVLAMK